MSIPPVIACEPIVPLTMLFMPWSAMAARVGALALLIVVSIKCVVFALLQRGTMSASRAMVSMFVANVVSTIAGLFVAFTFIAPAAGIGGVLATIAVSILPVRRLKRQFPRVPTALLTLIVVALYIGSIVLFVFAQRAMFDNNMLAYWLTKYAYIVCALLISMALTTFWEEWVVWRMSGAEEEAFVTPVFRANAVALFVVMLTAAILVLPERFRSSDFLVALLHRMA